MKIERYLPHVVTIALLTMAAIFRSPAHAAASVVSVLGILAHSFAVDRMATLAVKPSTNDETKRAIQDLNARVATLEYGVKTRGF